MCRACLQRGFQNLGSGYRGLREGSYGDNVGRCGGQSCLRRGHAPNNGLLICGERIQPLNPSPNTRQICGDTVVGRRCTAL